MTHLTEEIPMETSCDALLVKSVRIYQEVEVLYQSMPKDLSAPAVLKVMRMVGTMNALLQDAQALDKDISEVLKTDSILSESTETLLKKRDEILHRLYRDNQSITRKAENVKSLLHHEITSLSTGHQAIKGYRPVGAERQYIVRNTF